MNLRTTRPLQGVSALSQSGSLAPGSAHLPQSTSDDAPISSWRELEHERLTAKIPSSRTPSPMKVAKAGSQSSMSHTKIDHEATKALQKSITRALKRHISEEDEILRNSKRQRLQKHKVNYHTSSMVCHVLLIDVIL